MSGQIQTIQTVQTAKTTKLKSKGLVLSLLDDLNALFSSKPSDRIFQPVNLIKPEPMMCLENPATSRATYSPEGDSHSPLGDAFTSMGRAHTK